jgi:hypothetical protein
MLQSKYNFKRAMQLLTGAVLLALLISGILGSTRVYAAGVASPTGANACSVGTQVSDAFIQEETVLSVATQSNGGAELALLNGVNSCPAGTQSSDYYLLQEQAVLTVVTQGVWNPDEITSFNGATSTGPSSQ